MIDPRVDQFFFLFFATIVQINERFRKSTFRKWQVDEIFALLCICAAFLFLVENKRTVYTQKKNTYRSETNAFLASFP